MIGSTTIVVAAQVMYARVSRSLIARLARAPIQGSGYARLSCVGMVVVAAVVVVVYSVHGGAV